MKYFLILLLNLNIYSSCYIVDNIYVGMPYEAVEASYGKKIKIKEKGFSSLYFKDKYLYFFNGFLWRMEINKNLELKCEENENLQWENIEIKRESNKTIFTNKNLYHWIIIYNQKYDNKKSKISSNRY